MTAAGDDSHARRSAILLALAACVLGVLAYWTTAGGLFLDPWQAQVGIFVGAAVGLVVGRPAVGLLVAPIAVFVGRLTGPLSFWAPAESQGSSFGGLESVLSAAVACITAWLLAWVIKRGRLSADLAVLGVAVFVIVNMAVSLMVLTSSPLDHLTPGVEMPSIVDWLDGQAPEELRSSDDFLYVYVVNRLRYGDAYYATFASARPTLAPGLDGPSGVINFRLPYLYEVLAALPDSRSIVVLYSLVAGCAVLSLTWLQERGPRRVFAVVGYGAVATYAVVNGASTQVLFTELWAGLLIVVSLSADAASRRSRYWRPLMILSAVLILAAVMLREIAVFALLGGILSAVLGDAGQRRERLMVWGGVAAVAAALYGMHASMATPLLTSAVGQTVMGRGDIDFAMMALRYNTDVFSPPVWLPYLLSLTGVYGAFLFTNRGQRAFALTVSVALLLAFTVVGNGARAFGGTEANYWGVMVLLPIYAFIPSALGAVLVPSGDAPTGGRA